MVVGASLGVQGTARAQDNLRQILNSPGVNGFVMPGFEFLLNSAKTKFNDQGELTDAGTAKFLGECVDHFVSFVVDNKKNCRNRISVQNFQLIRYRSLPWIAHA